jgi:hypothetical protein
MSVVIEQIKEASDIVRVIGAYVQLRKTGSHYSGLCPFHSEKTPSFTVNPQRQRFHCYGCDADGDVFDFIARIQGLTFVEAKRLLASEAGITLKDSPISPEDRSRWAAERAAMERDLPAARLWKQTSIALGEELLNHLKSALFDPTATLPGTFEISDWEERIATWRRLDGAGLVEEFRKWRDREPEMVAAMVRVARDRELAEVRALIAYFQEIERKRP